MKRFCIVVSMAFLLILAFIVPISADAAFDYLDFIPDRPPTGSVPMELWVEDEFANLYRSGASWYGWVEYGTSPSTEYWYKNARVDFTAYTITVNGWRNGVHLGQTFEFSQDLMHWVDENGTPLDHFRLYGDVSPDTWIDNANRAGFDEGYLFAVGDGNEAYDFSDLAAAVIEAPVNVFMQFFQFEVLGVNFAQLAAVCVSLLAVVAVVLFFVRRVK